MTDPALLPLWAREPAKIVGWLVTAVVVIAAALVELSNDVVDLLPEKWKTPVRAATATVVTVGLIAGRLQTWMTRNGIGPQGNGKDGVYSPATYIAGLTETAQTVAAAKAATPDNHAR